MLFLWHLSVMSLINFNTKWGSKRMLGNPVGANRKRDWKPGSNNEVIYAVKNKGYSEGVVAKRSVQSCNLQRSTI